MATWPPCAQPVRPKARSSPKTGTVLGGDPLNNRGLLTKALAGYLEVRPGRFYVFDLVVNGSLVQDLSGALQVNDDLGTIAAILQQEASR